MNQHRAGDRKQMRTSASQSGRLKQLIQQLDKIGSEMLALESNASKRLDNLHETNRPSARNLLHYLALRRHDRREIQEQLASLGLSSLGRSESHVRSNVDAIHRILCLLADEELPAGDAIGLGFHQGRALLTTRTEALLGPKPPDRSVRIMVTMPGEAAEDYELVRELVFNGMDCMRINCAHDDERAWANMIRNLRRAMSETGTSCRVLMDLAGPKLRTGSIEPGPEVISWRPKRDYSGNVESPARVWLTPAEKPERPAVATDAILPVRDGWLAALTPGDLLKFFDARGASRSLTIVETVGENRLAESSQTAYVNSGTYLQLGWGPVRKAGVAAGVVGKLTACEQKIHLRQGSSLILTREDQPGRLAVYDEKGELLYPPRISVTLPEIFKDVRPGENILLDDGKIGGVIRRVTSDEIEVEITRASPNGSTLRADKGINLPDSHLTLPALTTKDLEDLPFIARNADLVGYSFVRNASDVDALQSQLTHLGGGHLGIVLKIETRRAFAELPNLLLAAMRSPAAGVMIARGDLAVECGWERMAEVQEEILWICEAAHTPVVWATQVLEKLAKEGMPSRAEITDAAMGERAECVMLNKGPYIQEAVKVLLDILKRMEAHQSKKSSMLRPLSLAEHFNIRK